jgi:GT2 family glycosyltransferase
MIASPPGRLQEQHRGTDPPALLKGRRRALRDNPRMSACIAGAPGALGERPSAGEDMVSLLVRSMARPSLAETLASIEHQTYRPLEIVVVNATGQPHPDLPPAGVQLQYRLADCDRQLPRAAAANRALDAAHGRWLMFVDDDDLIDPDHVTRLVQALEERPGTRVAHAGVRLVDAAGTERGALDEPVDVMQLWMANRLAIHAVLFERSLVATARFDESLDVYEDWDFWFQLIRQECFHHVPGPSATYRLVGLSGASEPHSPSRSRALRLPFYRKWLPLLTIAELEALAAAAEHARGGLRDAATELHRVQTESQAQHEIQEQALQAAHLAHQALQQQFELRSAQADQFAALLQQRDDELLAAREHIRQALRSYAELEGAYRATLGTLSWRLTAPLRWVRSHFASGHPVGLAHRLWRALPISNQQRLAVRSWLLDRHWGRRLTGQLSPRLMPTTAVDQPPPPIDKEQVRAEAEVALGDFLSGPGRIDLSCTMPAPEVSVIVVLFNQAGLSRLCLQSLADSLDVSFETLIVDNASTDRMPQLLERVDGAALLLPGENLGFLRAVNLAATRARGKYLVLLNNDAMLEPHTLRHAAARLDRDPGAGAVGGPILLWNGRLQEAGSIVWRDGSCQGYGRGEDPARPEFDHVRDVDYCSGAFLMLRRTLFESVGGLDEAFVPAYYEETDLCVRLWERGHRIVYDPAVRIRHFEFASEVAAGWAIELQQKHRALFVQRHTGFLAQRPLPSQQGVERARTRVAPGRQRVLVIDDRVPLPWLGQGYPRAALLVSALANAGHAVTHYPLQFPGELRADVRHALPETVEVMLDRGVAGLEPFLRSRQGLYDSVIVSRPHNMQALRRIIDRNPGLLEGTRLVYDAEAMFSLRDIARAVVEGRPFPESEQRARIDEELRLARGVDDILAVSEQEARHYRDAGFDPVHVLGHEATVVRDTPGFGSRSGFLFVGAMTDDDTPNSDSVRWFVREVWPLVVQALGPAIRLHLVGSCNAPSVQALADPRITVHGRVDCLTEHLDGARVFVVPTRYAAGIPHKAHEAAARGLPMVVTDLIAGQLGWQGFVPAATLARDFAAHCIRLHQDATAWQQQRAAVLDAVDRDCSPSAFRGVVELLMARPATAHGSPPSAP